MHNALVSKSHVVPSFFLISRQRYGVYAASQLLHELLGGGRHDPPGQVVDRPAHGVARHAPCLLDQQDGPGVVPYVEAELEVAVAGPHGQVGKVDAGRAVRSDRSNLKPVFKTF